MELNLFNFIILSLNTLTITSNVYANAVVLKPTPCSPSPCGRNSECREENSQAICCCQTDFIGTPPNCRPECTMTRQCPGDKACLHHKCVDPCVNECPTNADCRVIRHNLICSCRALFTGNPYVSCVPIPLSIPTQSPEEDPCFGACGDNAQCNINNQLPYCSCLPGFTGDPFLSCQMLVQVFAGSACASGSARVNGICISVD